MDNYRARGTKDILNPKKWKIFVTSKLRKLAGHDLDEEIAWAEQLIFRRSRCQQCVAEKACVHCKCITKEAMSEKDNKCSANQWGPALNASEWEAYKARYDIRIFVS